LGLELPGCALGPDVPALRCTDGVDPQDLGHVAMTLRRNAIDAVDEAGPFRLSLKRAE